MLKPLESGLLPEKALKVTQRSQLRKEGMDLKVPLSRSPLPKFLANARSDVVFEARGEVHLATLIYLHGFGGKGRTVRLNPSTDLPEGVRCVLPTARTIPMSCY